MGHKHQVDHMDQWYRDDWNLWHYRQWFDDMIRFLVEEPYRIFKKQDYIYSFYLSWYFAIDCYILHWFSNMWSIYWCFFSGTFSTCGNPHVHDYLVWSKLILYHDLGMPQGNWGSPSPMEIRWLYVEFTACIQLCSDKPSSSVRLPSVSGKKYSKDQRPMAWHYMSWSQSLYICLYSIYRYILSYSLSLFLVPGPSHKARQLAWKYGRGETWLHGYKSPECLFLCIEFSCLHINPIYIYT